MRFSDFKIEIRQPKAGAHHAQLRPGGRIFLINPLTGLPCAPQAAARAELLALTAGGTNTVGEFLACQVQSNSPICTEGAEGLDYVRNHR